MGGSAQFTLYLSSLWPFLQEIDSEATEKFYGLVVAAYSLGQIISGPIVGWWSTRSKSMVAPTYFCLTLTLIGNIIYVVASVIPSYQKWCILVARFVVGLGESRFLRKLEVSIVVGSLSLYQGFASTASTHKDRPKALSIATGGLAVGFSLGPAIQLASCLTELF